MQKQLQTIQKNVAVCFDRIQSIMIPILDFKLIQISLSFSKTKTSIYYNQLCGPQNVFKFN